MQSMQDDGEQDGVCAQADGAESNPVDKCASHMGKHDEWIAIQ